MDGCDALRVGAGIGRRVEALGSCTLDGFFNEVEASGLRSLAKLLLRIGSSHFLFNCLPALSLTAVAGDAA